MYDVYVYGILVALQWVNNLPHCHSINWLLSIILKLIRLIILHKVMLRRLFNHLRLLMLIMLLNFLKQPKLARTLQFKFHQHNRKSFRWFALYVIYLISQDLRFLRFDDIFLRKQSKQYMRHYWLLLIRYGR